MHINLTPELEELVRKKVESGLYNNQSEVIREGLRLLADQERIRESHLVRLRDAVAEGLEQADRGELLDGPEALEELRAERRDRRSSKERAG